MNYKGYERVKADIKHRIAQVDHDYESHLDEVKRMIAKGHAILATRSNLAEELAACEAAMFRLTGPSPEPHVDPNPNGGLYAHEGQHTLGSIEPVAELPAPEKAEDSLDREIKEIFDEVDPKWNQPVEHVIAEFDDPNVPVNDLQDLVGREVKVRVTTDKLSGNSSDESLRSHKSEFDVGGRKVDIETQAAASYLRSPTKPKGFA